jgi:hypothetical protein
MMVVVVVVGYSKLTLFFFVVLEFELRAYTLSHSTSFFWCVIFFFFQDRVSGTILPRVGFEPRS